MQMDKCYTRRSSPATSSPPAVGFHQHTSGKTPSSNHTHPPSQVHSQLPTPSLTAVGKESQVSRTSPSPSHIEDVPAPHARACTGQETQHAGLGRVAVCQSVGHSDSAEQKGGVSQTWGGDSSSAALSHATLARSLSTLKWNSPGAPGVEGRGSVG